MALDLDLNTDKLPVKEEKSEKNQVRSFVEQGVPQEKPARRRHTVQRKMCSFMIPVPLLERLDRFCEKKAQTRSGIINLAIVKILEDGL